MSNLTILSAGHVTTPKGFVAGAASTGMKSGGAYDVTLIVSTVDCSAAGVFTQSQVVAAPVIVDREVLAKNAAKIRGVVANSKYANACTGQVGIDATRLMQQQAGALLECDADQLFVLSTGVIGAQIPLDKIGQGIDISALNLGDNGEKSAHAIMTTDTTAKHLAVMFKVGDSIVTVGGIAKGSGMIHPNMATMLGVLTTDAHVDPALLQTVLTTATDKSYNRITVDGDTSTNDTVLLLANGKSGVEINEETLPLFQEAIDHVCTELAKMIVKDGEGVTKFVEIRVSGTQSVADAHQIGNTIATSPLVKTAFAGSDPNWGRILAAAGRAGISFDQNETNLWISTDGTEWLQLLSAATPTEYAELDAAAIFAEPEFQIHLSVGNGEHETTLWTGDLTHDYITINADYRS